MFDLGRMLQCGRFLVHIVKYNIFCLQVCDFNRHIPIPSEILKKVMNKMKRRN